MLPDLGGMLVPRGGIEPPTRGFSVPSSPSRRASFPLGTSVKHPSRPVKAGTPKHGHARSLRPLDDWEATAETLVALGAPLSGWRPCRRLAPEAALAALRFASTDASLLRSLSVVLA